MYNSNSARITRTYCLYRRRKRKHRVKRTQSHSLWIEFMSLSARMFFFCLNIYHSRERETDELHTWSFWFITRMFQEVVPLSLFFSVPIKNKRINFNTWVIIHYLHHKLNVDLYMFHFQTNVYQYLVLFYWLLRYLFELKE